MSKHSPSSRRVARRFASRRQAAYETGQVVRDGWDPGQYVPAPVEGEGSQVPPARDSFGKELPEGE